MENATGAVPPVVMFPPLLQAQTQNVEYRLVIKKKQTFACDACRKRKGKCSGVWPCKYCTDRGETCHFSTQLKRGRRKLDSNDAPEGNLVKAQKLWAETERGEVVTTFCGMREWLGSNLLVIDSVKEASTPMFTAQSYIVNAWMARISRDFEKAFYYFRQAKNMINDTEDPDPVSRATAYLLLADYAPSEHGHFASAWQLIKDANIRTTEGRHVYFYAMSYNAVSSDIIEKHSNILSTGSAALQTKTADLWDTTNFLVLKVCTAMATHWSYITSLEFFKIFPTLSVEKRISDGVMMDIMTAEIIMQSQPHRFGFEFITCLKIMKLAMFWASGQRDKALHFSIEILQELMNLSSTKTLFMVAECRFLLVPLIVANESGIFEYNNTIVNLVENMCIDQRSLIDDLVPMFQQLRMSDSPKSREDSSDATPSNDTSPPTVIPSGHSVLSIVRPDPAPAVPVKLSHLNATTTTTTTTTSSSRASATASRTHQHAAAPSILQANATPSTTTYTNTISAPPPMYNATPHAANAPSSIPVDALSATYLSVAPYPPMYSTIPSMPLAPNPPPSAYTTTTIPLTTEPLPHAFLTPEQYAPSLTSLPSHPPMYASIHPQPVYTVIPPSHSSTYTSVPFTADTSTIYSIIGNPPSTTTYVNNMPAPPQTYATIDSPPCTPSPTLSPSNLPAVSSPSYVYTPSPPTAYTNTSPPTLSPTEAATVPNYFSNTTPYLPTEPTLPAFNANESDIASISATLASPSTAQLDWENIDLNYFLNS